MWGSYELILESVPRSLGELAMEVGWEVVNGGVGQAKFGGQRAPLGIPHIAQ